MAEAAVEDSGSRFFCHQCSARDINPTLPDYTCPQCDSGFIEELIDDTQFRSSPVEDRTPRFDELLDQSLMETLTGHVPEVFRRHTADAESQEPDGDVPMATDGEADDPMAPRPFGQGRIVFRRTGPRNPRHQAIESIVQQLLTGLTGGAMFARTGGTFPIGTMFNLYGNPGDYAWGAGGLDSIITQLLNQLDGTGPPPASKDKIDTLPETKISKEQVEKTLQCSVCMEDFVIDETVRRLPCNHHYHTDCIVPWLELHGTCPVCRKNLEGQDTTSGPAAGDPGIPNTDFLEQDPSPMQPSTSSATSSSSSRQPPRGSSNHFDSIDEYD